MSEEAKRRSSESADLSRSNRRIKELEKLVTVQQERIDAMGKKRFRINPAKGIKPRKGSFTRVIIPDTHGCFVDETAIGAFLKDLERLRPAEVVWLGDHIDCGGFLAEHHTLGFVAEADYSFQDDIDAANDLLDRVQKLSPGAAHHYICGNHELRIEKWCITKALRNKENAEVLMRALGPEHQLRLASRGISFYRRSEKHFGLKHYGVIKLGHCYFVHGNSTAKHAASAMLAKYGSNVVYGHTHRPDEATKNTVHSGVIKAWSPGCLCRLQPLWMDTNPTDWSHGYGVQLVQPDGTFLYISVPIEDGHSYLMPFIKQLS